MADVTVTFAGDTSALDAAINKIKTEAQQLDPVMVELGSRISAAFKKIGLDPGKAFGTMDPKQQQALAQYGASLEKVTTATKGLGEESQRAGINIGNLLERIAIRMVIFEALRLAIQGVKYAFDQISETQQARIQFDAMADSIDYLAGRFKYLEEQASGAFLPIEKAVQVRNILEDFGATTDQAAVHVKDLGQWSKILGVDADRLAEALGRVSEGEGSLQDMRLVTRMMGEQGAAGRELVQSLVDQEKALKRLETENAVVARSMEAVTRATEQMDERVTRSRTRGQEFLKETGILPGIQSQLPRLAMHPEMSPEYLQATGQLHLPHMGLGVSPVVMNQVRDYITQYREGLKEIQKEEGLTDQAMRANAAAGVFSVDYVMRKYRDAHDDKMRDFREEAEAQTRGAQAQVTTAQAGIAGTKAALATVLPQAVTTPPEAVWREFTSSLAGQQAQLKQSIDSGFENVEGGMNRVANSTEESAENMAILTSLLRSGA